MTGRTHSLRLCPGPLHASENPVGDLSGTSLLQCLGRYPGRLWDLDLAKSNVGGQTVKVGVCACLCVRLCVSGGGRAGV